MRAFSASSSLVSGGGGGASSCSSSSSSSLSAGESSGLGVTVTADFVISSFPLVLEEDESSPSSFKGAGDMEELLLVFLLTLLCERRFF